MSIVLSIETKYTTISALRSKLVAKKINRRTREPGTIKIVVFTFRKKGIFQDKIKTAESHGLGKHSSEFDSVIEENGHAERQTDVS